MNKGEILQAIKNGYKEFLLCKSKEAAQIWLPAWKAAQNILIQRNYKTEKEISDFFGYTFLNWFYDLDMALMDSDLNNERLEFNRYVSTISGYRDQDNPRTNIAESLAALNRYDEAEAMLSKWLEEDPLWTYGWTCWANIFLDNEIEDKAFEIIERGMKTIEDSTQKIDLENFYPNAEIIYSRLGKTERADYCSEKTREQQLKTKAISEYSKVGRNEPCPCGSGKKYKKCCGR